MTPRTTRRYIAVAMSACAALTVACVQLAPTTVPSPVGTGLVEGPSQGIAAQPGTTAADEAAPGASSPGMAGASATPLPSRQTVAVRQGSIAEQLRLNGRVTPLQETRVQFNSTGRVATVLVEPGQVIERGQPLLQAETAEIQRDLAAARSRVEVDTLRMEQGRAQAQARQRQAEHRAEGERIRRERQLAEGQTAVRRAQEDLARVKAGAPAAERRAAEEAVVSARSGVERAEADLARASAGPTEAELRSADQQVWAARLALHRSEAELARLRRGADPTELRAAEREVAGAQTALERARLDYDRLLRGDPLAVTAAERDVQRAQIARRTAQETRIDSRASRDAQRTARASRDSAVASAQLSLQEAQDRLTAARRGPAAADVEMAVRAVKSAEAALETARERLETVKKGPDELTLATANQAVESAKLAAREAERRYLDLEAGPPADRVAAAREGVRSARVTLAGSLGRLAEVNSRPTRAELQEAEDRVVAAQSALAQIESEPAAPQDETDPATYDLIVMERNLEQARSQVESLERELASATLHAPSAGTISAVLVRAGDPLDRDTDVVNIAGTGEPIVTADLTSEDAARLAVGQRAIVTFEGDPSTPYDATVSALVDGSGRIGRAAHLSVAWSGSPRAFGLGADVAIRLQEKANVLLIPQRAVRSSGSRRYVEYLEGDARRTADIVLGITDGVDVEVVRGLREGQIVIVGPTGAAAGATPPSATPAPAR